MDWYNDDNTEYLEQKNLQNFIKTDNQSWLRLNIITVKNTYLHRSSSHTCIPALTMMLLTVEMKTETPPLPLRAHGGRTFITF